MSDGITAVQALKQWQTQLDPEGIEVGVSRQALEEVLDDYQSLTAENERLREVISGKITNRMKAECMGEFSWEEDAPYFDEEGNEVEYVATRTVPWDLCKDIYKAMLKEAIEELDNDSL